MKGSYPLISTKKCLHILGQKLKNDKEYYYSYQANIAVSYIDSEYNYRKKYNKKYLNRHDRHIIANDAAINFINLLFDIK